MGKAEVENLYHLVDQRVSSQNDATLVQFIARIVYDDDSSVLLNSFADFTSYTEVRPLVSRSLHLGWTFLIKFRNKEYPEKQQIDVSFFSRGRFEELEFDFIEATIAGRRRMFNEGVTLRISHTDRTWGTDIDSLLTGHLSTLFKSDPPWREFIRHHSAFLGFLSGVALFCATISTSIFLIVQRVVEFFAPARELSLKTATTLEQLAQQGQMLLRILALDPTPKYTFFGFVFVIIALVGSSIVGALISGAAEGGSRSFVLLTNRSVVQKQAWDQRRKNSAVKISLSVVSALLMSIAGNWIFDFLLKSAPH
ncbi:MAG: hypothetical protein WD073_04275 [Xanthobacteraceae bacterium]